MPIEQLLARYGITSAGAAGPSPSSAAAPAVGQGALRRAARGQRRQAAPPADGEPAAQPAAAEELAMDATGGAEDDAERPAKRQRADGGVHAQEAPLVAEADVNHGGPGTQRSLSRMQDCFCQECGHL